MTFRARDVFMREPPAGFDGIFLWDFLAGAFGPTITPMDWDGVVERRGSFLVFETKAPGTEIPQGQRLTLLAATRDERFTVVLCAKRPEDITQWEVWTRRKHVTHYGDASALRAWCQCWYEDKEARDPRCLEITREPGQEG